MYQVVLVEKVPLEYCGMTGGLIVAGLAVFDSLNPPIVYVLFEMPEVQLLRWIRFLEAPFAPE